MILKAFEPITFARSKYRTRIIPRIFVAAKTRVSDAFIFLLSHRTFKLAAATLYSSEIGFRFSISTSICSISVEIFLFIVSSPFIINYVFNARETLLKDWLICFFLFGLFLLFTIHGIILCGTYTKH